MKVNKNYKKAKYPDNKLGLTLDTAFMLHNFYLDPDNAIIKKQIIPGFYADISQFKRCEDFCPLKLLKTYSLISLLKLKHH